MNDIEKWLKRIKDKSKRKSKVENYSFDNWFNFKTTIGFIMLGFIKSLITNDDLQSSAQNNYSTETQLQIATCALFLEIANSDDDFSIEEKVFIEKTMRDEFNLDDELVAKLLEHATKRTEESISLYELTEVINKSYSQEEKYKIIKNLWRLAYADGNLDQYEEYFMRTISNNLHLEHSDMIAAKLEVKGEQN